MKIHSSKFGLCGVAAFGVALAATFTACGDKNTTEVTEQTGMDILAKGEKLPECGKDNAGDMLYVTDSAAVYYCGEGKWLIFNDGAEGTSGANSCSAVQNEKTKDIVFTCKTDDGKDATYTVESGASGSVGMSAYEVAKAAGFKGTEAEWLASLKGKTGNSCRLEQNEEKTVTTIYCQVDDGTEVSYVVKNGADGKSCSVAASEDGKSAVVSCEGSDDVVVNDGAPGVNCTVADKKEGDKVVGYDLICGETVMGTIYNGYDGKMGVFCKLEDKYNGIVEVTCGSGKDAKTVELFKAMCGNEIYDPATAVCNDGIEYKCDEKPYDSKKEFCYSGKVIDLCGGETYNPTTEYCMTLTDEKGIESFKVEDLLNDSRDNHAYKTVSIEVGNYNEVWMAQNLNYSGSDLTSGSWCYNNDEKNCESYGRLYTWTSAIGETDGNCGAYRDCNLGDLVVQGACPAGWHIPKLAEWNALIEATGGLNESGYVLKAQSGWNSGDGVDAYGFSVISTGVHNSFYGGDLEYTNLGDETRFWSTGVNSYPWTMENPCPEDPEDDTDDYICEEYAINAKTVVFGNEKKILIQDGDKRDGFSIRCVKDKN